MKTSKTITVMELNNNSYTGDQSLASRSLEMPPKFKNFKPNIVPAIFKPQGVVPNRSLEMFSFNEGGGVSENLKNSKPHKAPTMYEPHKKPDLEISDKIIELYFYDVIYHHYRKTWSVFLKDNQNEDMFSARHLKIKLEDSVKLNKVPIIVMTEAVGFIMWIMLVERNEKTKKYFAPTYCAFSTNSKYLLVSRNRIPAKTMQVLINTFECQSLKYCDLFGKNINGLMTMLQHKSNSSRLSIERQVKKKFKPDVERSDTGNDYTLENQAKSCIRNLFHVPPQIETLSIKAKGYQAFPDVKVEVGLVYKSRNIPRFLEALAGMGILKMPVADYLIMFPSKGKNVLKCVVEQ